MDEELTLMETNDNNTEMDYVFDDEDFETNDHHGYKVRKGRKRPFGHFIVIGIALLIIILVAIRVVIWNKGVDSDYDPNEDTSQYDVEPTDHIQPLNDLQLEGKNSDGKLTLLTIGNSPFADDYDDNNLAAAIAKAYKADVINVGMEDSFITQKNTSYDKDSPEDGISLPQIANAIASGDYSIVKEAAGNMSSQAEEAAELLSKTDMSMVDGIIIMYNLEDYKDHRPLGSEGLDDPTSIYGALYGSIEKLQEAYPYIRIVVLSMPAGGVTIDDFFVDGDIQNIGCGTLSDYVTFEIEATATRGASFVDVYYGAINVDQRDKYLVDDYHINDKGAKSIANRVKKLITFQEP